MGLFFRRLGDGFDRLWLTLGVDLEAYARRRPDRAEKVAIWLLAIAMTLGYAGFYYLFSSLLFAWESAFDWGKEALTFAFMCAVFAAAATAPIAGRLVDAGKGRWALSGGMALGALALLALAGAQSYAQFFAAWVAIGAAQGLSLYEPCFAFVTRTTRTRAPRNIAFITLVAGFASTIAFPAGAFLAEAHGWRMAALAFGAVLGGIGALSLYAGATLLECCPTDEAPSERAARNREAFAAARRRPEYWLLYIAFPLIALCEGLVLTHIIPILIDGGLTLSQAVAASALFGPMQVAGRLLMIWASGQVSALIITFVSFIGVACATALLLAVGGRVEVAFMFAALFGASYGVISILKPVLTAEMLGRSAFGAISGSMATMFLVAVAASPQVGSWLWSVGGYGLAIKAAVGIAGLALIALIALHAVTRRPRARY